MSIPPVNPVPLPSDPSFGLGTVHLDPLTPVVAGSVGTWTITLTVGSFGIDEGGTIKLAHRFASDWETPQFTHPDRSGFATVRTSGEARLTPRFDAKGHDRPWMKAMVIDVSEGSLAPGDTVVIVLGDRSQGSPGTRAQTFIESAHVFQIFVDPTNACVARAVACPVIPIVAGAIERLICLVPTRVTVGQAVTPLIKGEDRWSNPVEAPSGLGLTWNGPMKMEKRGGAFVALASGSGRLHVRAGSLQCQSNWITATNQAADRFWGDLHAQTGSTLGTGTEEEYFRFGRKWAGLDFMSHQGNDFQMSDESWRRLNEVTRQFNESGRFVVLPGYEWSANSPAGGDRNVIYDREDQPIFRSSHWQVPEAAVNAGTPAHPADVLFQHLRDNGHAFTCAHVGGRYADIRKYFDAEMCPLVEVVSCWGVFEWLLWDAFDHGYVVGIMANSDGHKGRPGAEGPGAGEFGIAGGLTCVLAPELTRPAIFSALRERRCYGTTGARIDLDFTVDGDSMGAVISRPRGVARFSVRGTAPLESVELYRGKAVIKTFRPPEFARSTSHKVRVSWRGSRMRGRGRRTRWDGSLRVEGNRIVSAHTFAFDSPSDGITEVTDCAVNFRSQTTGDTDGIELILASAAEGQLVLESQQGRWEVNLSELSNGARTFEVGALDRSVRFESYPIELLTEVMSGEYAVEGQPGALTPFFVKVTQCDGQMAWASPIYFDLTQKT